MGNKQVIVEEAIGDRQSQIRQQLQTWMGQLRQHTKALFAGIDHATFCCQVHPEFSPIGWHLGHIAYTESLWILEKCAGLPPIEPTCDRRIFIADHLPKVKRVELPPCDQVCEYLDQVRSQVFRYLEIAPLEQQERLWLWLLQHEVQHHETISFVLEMHKLGRREAVSGQRLDVGKQESREGFPSQSCATPLSLTIKIPNGYFVMGSDAIYAQDNERPKHQVYLDTYYIDRYPVTRGQFRQFIDANGYRDRLWWSEAGWQWLQSSSQSNSRSQTIQQPLYWDAWAATDDHPVCGVSWYEANAYARFVGKRLPTEAEWEKAASWNFLTNQHQTYPWGEEQDFGSDRFPCNYNHLHEMTTPVDCYPQGKSPSGCYDMLGNVWEWTASIFQPYPDFVAFPYAGYSSTYFDDQHYVLRGGSWATCAWGLRSSFRNWYHPHTRQIFAGFRCVSSD